LPLNQGKESFHQPAQFITTQSSTTLCSGLHPIAAMWCNHLNASLAQFYIQRVTVVGAITNQVFRLRFDHVELEAQLHQGDLMVIRRMGTDRQRLPVTIHNGHDFHALATLGRSYLIATTFGLCKRCVDETFRFIERTYISQRIGKIDEHIPQDLVAAQLLEATMHRFVVRIALRQHLPLGTGIENPENGFDGLACGNRFAAWSTGRNVFLRKVVLDAFPVLVA